MRLLLLLETVNYPFDGILINIKVLAFGDPHEIGV
jgi:hypothetical protein